MPRDKKAYDKKWRENNPDYIKEYNKSEAGLKSKRISDWKRRGVSRDCDFDEIYDIYISTDLCDYCNVELVEGGKRCNRTKCLDHNHKTREVRGIICHTCNRREVFRYF
tara:strand:- start:674 stop:1000 length:327 start_codon:yes stop_codon:yes gene_type:complete